MLALALSNIFIAIAVFAALASVVGAVIACVYFVRAISGKDDDSPQQFEDGPHIVSEED